MRAEPLNPRLAALLDKIDRNRTELAESNAAFRQTNDRFARFLRNRGSASIPPPPPKKGDWR